MIVYNKHNCWKINKIPIIELIKSFSQILDSEGEKKNKAKQKFRYIKCLSSFVRLQTSLTKIIWTQSFSNAKMNVKLKVK